MTPNNFAMKNSDVFRSVLTSLAREERDFVCHCLEVLAKKKVIPSAQAIELQSWVMQKIYPYFTYNSWLQQKYPEVYKAGGRHTSSWIAEQKARLVWVESLIKEWEAIEAAAPSPASGDYQ